MNLPSRHSSEQTHESQKNNPTVGKMPARAGAGGKHSPVAESSRRRPGAPVVALLLRRPGLQIPALFKAVGRANGVAGGSSSAMATELFHEAAGATVADGCRLTAEEMMTEACKTCAGLVKDSQPILWIEQPPVYGDRQNQSLAGWRACSASTPSRARGRVPHRAALFFLVIPWGTKAAGAEHDEPRRGEVADGGTWPSERGTEDHETYRFLQLASRSILAAGG